MKYGLFLQQFSNLFFKKFTCFFQKTPLKYAYLLLLMSIWIFYERDVIVKKVTCQKKHKIKQQEIINLQYFVSQKF